VYLTLEAGNSAVKYLLLPQLSGRIGVDFRVSRAVFANTRIMHANRMALATYYAHVIPAIKTSVVDFHQTWKKN
jgi:hypothetical protein